MKHKTINSIAIIIIGVTFIFNSYRTHRQNKDINTLYENDLLFAKQDNYLLEIDSLVAKRLEELFNHLNK